MPTISREYTAAPNRYRKGGNHPRYIVVHYTANTASARNEANNVHFNNDGRDASAHFYLDGGGTIYQLLDLSDTAYAVGAWEGNTQYVGNSESVSIEVCNSGGPFTTDEVAELRWLVRRLMGELGIDADHVVRHFDCHGGPAGRKECPYYYAGFNNAAWEALRDTITREELQVEAKDVWNCDLAYQEVKTGKQVNRPAWNIVSWTGHNVEYMLPKVNDMQPKVSDLANRSVKLEKAVADLTALVKAQQKTLNAIVKKLA